MAQLGQPLRQAWQRRIKENKTFFAWLGLLTSLLCVTLVCFTTVVLSGAARRPTPTVVDLVVVEIQSPVSSPTASARPPSASTTPTYTPVPTQTPTPRPTETSIPPSPTQPATPTAQPPLKVHFVDVGQGDAILIQGPGGEVGLIDGGEADSGIVLYLQGLQINHLDFIFATHPHSDHIGGLVQVLRTFPVANVITNGVKYTTPTYADFINAVIASKAVYLEAKRGDTLTFGELNFTVLSPISNQDPDINNGSLVMRMVYKQIAFLFTGDAQTTAEESMLSAGLNMEAAILNVAHHGSRTSSSPAFLAAVKPQVAVYSAGRGNDYGYPHPETIAALKAVGAKIYGTDVNGTVIVTTDGGGYSVDTARQGEPAPPPLPSPTVETPQELSIEVSSLTSPIAPGGRARLTIQTAPGAKCTITVYLKSGPSQAAGLGPQTAGADGSVTWSWKVGSATTQGTWRIVVTADLNGQYATEEIPFEVKK